MSYDRNGNILKLTRNGYLDGNASSTYEIDNLDYVYGTNSNELQWVNDMSNSWDGFKDGQNPDPGKPDYGYDSNGNMVLDWNKGIMKVAYNHLNLPTKVAYDINEYKKITYLYNARGVKVEKIVDDHTVSPTVYQKTEYLDGFQYSNEALQYFPTSEGYVDVTEGNKFNYVYNYTDHLGNIRLSYSKPKAEDISILEENHYYPFGMKHINYGMQKNMYVLNPDKSPLYAILEPTERSNYQYKYNGKEFQDELGLGWYDYQARNYDPAIGIWMNIDPKAETSRRFSPYAYALNNPVYFIDPDGMQADDWISWIGKGGQQHITYDSNVKTVEDAEKKGYVNIEKVFDKGTGRAESTGEVIEFNANGTYRVNGGTVADVDDDSFTTQGGTHISENKGVIDASGDFLPGGLQDTGDAITLAAIPVAATGIGIPLAATMAEFGGTMSGIGTALELVNDAAEGKLTVKKAVTKGVIEALSTKIGGSSAFGPVEQIINDNIFNGLDRTIDEANKK